MPAYVAPEPITSIQDPLLERPALPKPYSDSSRLAPEDAFLAHSPPRFHANAKTKSEVINGAPSTSSANLSGQRKREKDRGRSGSRRGKGEWKKLLWVKQPKCTFGFPCT